MSIVDLMGRVAQERARQISLYGEQNHPDLCPSLAGMINLDEGSHCEELKIDTAQEYKNYNAELVKSGELYWYAILMEEVAEAHREALVKDVPAQIEELVQVMAVCAAMIDCIQRRNK